MGGALRALVVALLDPASYPDVRRAIPEEMARFGPMAVEPLLAVLTDDDWEVRWNAVEALRKIGDLRAVMPLPKVLTDRVGIVRKAAIDALARFKDARAVGPLAQVLKDELLYFRSAAAEALEEIGALSSDLLVEINRIHAEIEEDNLVRWRRSNESLYWVKSHRGNWNHDDWLQFLESLKSSEFWPMRPEGVRVVLEELKKEYIGGLIELWISLWTQRIEIVYEHDSYYPTQSDALRFRYEALEDLKAEFISIGKPAILPLSKVLNHEDPVVREKTESLLAVIRGFSG
jgi:HEAT repeat protein